MKSYIYLVFIVLSTSQTIQTTQAPIQQQAKKATPLELQMIKQAGYEGNLSEEALQVYLKQGVDINAEDCVGFSGRIKISFPASGQNPAQDIIVFLLFLVRSDGVIN